jgi:hypothetical protein
LGKNAGFKEILSSPSVPERVKRVVKHLMVCMGQVVGSNAHRTYLRHVNKSYCLRFGPPLVFTTPNVADTRHIVMRRCLHFCFASLGFYVSSKCVQQLQQCY